VTLFYDGLLVLGCSAVVYGAWQYSPPAAWIIGGLLAIVGAVRMAINDSKQADSETVDQ
jgi:hypothetical protein